MATPSSYCTRVALCLSIDQKNKILMLAIIKFSSLFSENLPCPNSLPLTAHIDYLYTESRDRRSQCEYRAFILYFLF